MRLTYDQVEDVLYIQLCDEPMVDSFDQEPGVTVDLGEGGRVVGIEILDASERLEVLSDGVDAASKASALLQRRSQVR